MKTVNVTQVPADAQLIDVREADEFAAGHAASAKLIPLSEFTSRVSELDTDRDIYLICRSGNRSGQACQYLEQAHGVEAINVAGGTMAWVDADLPVEK